MMKNRHPRWLHAKIAIGLIAIALLWLPFPGEGLDMSFSGPVKGTRGYGILSYITVVTHYKPKRISFLSGSNRDTSKIMEEGDSIWSEDDSSVTFVRVKDRELTIDCWSLALTCALTALIFWLAVLWPLRGYMRSCRASRLQSAL
jgi:hypothetical protein